MPRPPARRKLFAPRPLRDQPGRVTKAHNERDIADLAEKLKDKPVGRVPSNSDDSDELVTKSTNARNRRGVPRKEVFASGGLGKGDGPATKHDRKRTSDTFKEPDQASDRSPGKKRKVRSTEVRSVIPASNGNLSKAPTAPLASNGNRPRLQKPSIVMPTVSRTEPPRANSQHDHSPPIAERSILADIKRRPRQASILSNVNPPDDETLGNLTGFDDLDDLNDLEPNDESTPMDSRTRTFHGQNTRTPPYPERGPRTTIPSTPATLPQINASSRPTTGPNDEGHRLVQPLPSLLDDNSTYAPPQSSSPLRSSPQHSPRHAVPLLQQRTNRLTKVITNTTTNSHKPKQSPPQPPKAPSTQSLQNLMPQPRRKGRQLRQKAPKDDFDIPSDTPSHSSPAQPSPTNDSSFLAPLKQTKAKGKQAARRKSAAVNGGKAQRQKPGKANASDTATTTAKLSTSKSGAIGQRKSNRRKSTTPPPPISNLSSLSKPPHGPSESVSATKKNLQQPLRPSSSKGVDNKYNISRPRRGSNKENQRLPNDLSPESSESCADLPSSVTSSPPEIEQGRGTRRYGKENENGKQKGKGKTKVGGGTGGMGWGKTTETLDNELSAMRRKFEDVDDWGLEYEDVSVGEGIGSRGGSSPTRRWR